MSTLEKALEIAAIAHSGQRDKSGENYIMHPLRVMMKMESDEERITAILHDVVEDSKYNFDDLQHHGFSDNVIEAVRCLTKTKNLGYREYIDNIRNNSIAIKVKLADLEDNMNLTRLNKSLDKKRLEKIELYHSAYLELKGM